MADSDKPSQTLAAFLNSCSPKTSQSNIHQFQSSSSLPQQAWTSELPSTTHNTTSPLAIKRLFLYSPVKQGDCRAMPDSTAIAAFTERWSKAGGNELANSQLFLSEFYTLFGFPPPDPATSENETNAYWFERADVLTKKYDQSCRLAVKYFCFRSDTSHITHSAPSGTGQNKVAFT